MRDQEDRELDLLFRSVLDQSISADETDRLEEILMSDRHARLSYLRLMEIDSLLRQAHHPNNTKVTPSPAESGFRFNRAAFLFSLYGCVALAVVITVAVFRLTSLPKPIVENQEPDPSPPAISIANVDQIGFGASGTDLPFAVGEELFVLDAINLDSGTMRLRFGSGVVICLSGPGSLELTGPNQCRLTSGRLCASVPPSAVGFEVLTPAGKVVDLGTRFGVEASRFGTTETHVMEGRVTATAVGTNGYESAPFPLVEGQAAGFDLTSQRVLPRRFQPGRFRDELSLLRGIVNRSATIRLLHEPNVAVDGATLSSDSQIFVLGERQNVLLTDALSSQLAQIATEFVPGDATSVDSYLLHGFSDSGGRTISGWVEFEQPILGIVLDGAALASTDANLGNVETQYPMAEVSKYRSTEPDDGKDTIRLSPDRRRVEFRLTLQKAMDQVRILVAGQRVNAD